MLLLHLSFCISLFSLLYIFLFTFNPDIVKVKREWEYYPLKSASPDPIKCLIISFLISLFVFVIIKINERWNFKKIMK